MVQLIATWIRIFHLGILTSCNWAVPEHVLLTASNTAKALSLLESIRRERGGQLFYVLHEHAAPKVRGFFYGRQRCCLLPENTSNGLYGQVDWQAIFTCSILLTIIGQTWHQLWKETSHPQGSGKDLHRWEKFFSYLVVNLVHSRLETSTCANKHKHARAIHINTYRRINKKPWSTRHSCLPF